MYFLFRIYTAFIFIIRLSEVVKPFWNLHGNLNRYNLCRWFLRSVFGCNTAITAYRKRRLKQFHYEQHFIRAFGKVRVTSGNY